MGSNYGLTFSLVAIGKRSNGNQRVGISDFRSTLAAELEVMHRLPPLCSFYIESGSLVKEVVINTSLNY